MSGRRHVMDSTGTSYEDCVRLLLGRVASLVHVPRDKDFGIDFYCQPRIHTVPQTETVAELGSLQVKGGKEKLTYGGLNRRGEWREYEFPWLRSLATPLYLAKVDRGCKTVELFSLWPLWLIFWQTFSLQSRLRHSPGWYQLPRVAGPASFTSPQWRRQRRWNAMDSRSGSAISPIDCREAQ